PKIKYIDCYGDKGYIELSVSGGYGPYICSWTSLKGFTSSDLKIYNLDADVYTVVVEDQHGNRYTNSYTINGKDPVEWLMLPSSKTDLDCFGDEDGYINLQISGGTQPYSIEWQGPNLHVTDVNNVSHLIAGQYTAYIKDSKDCTPAETFNKEVTQPALLELEAEVTDNKCNALQEGAIELTIKGGTPDYSYRWSGFGVVPEQKDQSNLAAGEYHLHMEDHNRCAVDTLFTIKEREALHALLSGGNSICEGEEMELYINVEGTSPWSVTYTDGHDIEQKEVTERTSSITVKPSVSVEYSLIKVTDAVGCELETSGTVPVEVYVNPEVSILSTGADCCLGDAVIVDMMFFNAGPWSVSYTDGNHVYTDGPFTSAHTELAITPTATGTTHYTILTVSNEHCTTEVNYEFDVITYAYPNLTIDVPPYICQPNPIELVMHPTGDSPWVVTYTVNGQHLEEDVTADGQKIVHTPTREDNIFVFESIRSGENCITRLGKQYQTKVGMLPLDATLISGPNVVCRDSEVDYHTQAISYADKYVWELPEGFSIASGLGSADVTIAVGHDAVSGEIKVHGVNDCGEGESSSIYVEVNKPIEEGVEITSPLYVCKNAAMFQLSVSEVTGATRYEWTVPTGYTITSGQGTRSVIITIDEYAV
ncbi:MAG: SprB repeat-containing protein, partial [Paludibacteraceae bacterium]|nr:SprB repeat-containing protein [Paludibacteraceae bacterium]